MRLAIVKVEQYTCYRKRGIALEIEQDVKQLGEQRDFVRLGEKGAMPTAGYAYAKTYICV
jgi:hypothetical protein